MARIKSLDYFDVCLNCKKAINHYNYNVEKVCAKTKRKETLPEGVEVVEYEFISFALSKFRAENNGKCPYFEERFSLIKAIKKVFGK